MATAQPFLPRWRAICGGVERHGEGLLPPELKDRMDSFDVLCGGFKLTVQPKVGRILADGTPVAALNAPCALRWFRRMEIQISTKDTNGAPPDCLWYGLGLEHGGQSIGYQIQKDGTATWGELG